MLDCPEKTGTGVPVASLAVGHRLLEPLYAAHVHALQCFLGVSCALAHAAHASPRASGAGSKGQRVVHEDPRCAWHVRTLRRAA